MLSDEGSFLDGDAPAGWGMGKGALAYSNNVEHICSIFYDVSAHQYHVIQHQPQPNPLQLLQSQLIQTMLSVLLEHTSESNIGA